MKTKQEFFKFIRDKYYESKTILTPKEMLKELCLFYAKQGTSFFHPRHKHVTLANNTAESKNPMQTLNEGLKNITPNEDGTFVHMMQAGLTISPSCMEELDDRVVKKLKLQKYELMINIEDINKHVEKSFDHYIPTSAHSFVWINLSIAINLLSEDQTHQILKKLLDSKYYFNSLDLLSRLTELNPVYLKKVKKHPIYPFINKPNVLTLHNLAKKSHPKQLAMFILCELEETTNKEYYLNLIKESISEPKTISQNIILIAGIIASQIEDQNYKCQIVEKIMILMTHDHTTALSAAKVTKTINDPTNLIEMAIKLVENISMKQKDSLSPLQLLDYAGPLRFLREIAAIIPHHLRPKILSTILELYLNKQTNFKMECLDPLLLITFYSQDNDLKSNFFAQLKTNNDKNMDILSLNSKAIVILVKEASTEAQQEWWYEKLYASFTDSLIFDTTKIAKSTYVFTQAFHSFSSSIQKNLLTSLSDSKEASFILPKPYAIAIMSQFITDINNDPNQQHLQRLFEYLSLNDLAFDNQLLNIYPTLTESEDGPLFKNVFLESIMQIADRIPSSQRAYLLYGLLPKIFMEADKGIDKITIVVAIQKLREHSYKKYQYQLAVKNELEIEFPRDLSNIILDYTSNYSL